LDKIFQYTQTFIACLQDDKEKKAFQHYIIENRDEILSLLTRSSHDLQDGIIDIRNIKKWVKSHSLFPMVHRLVEGIVQKVNTANKIDKTLEAMSQDKDKKLQDQDKKNQKNGQSVGVPSGKINISIIDMTPQEILLVFVGKSDVAVAEKQEEVSQFLDRFLQLQTQYRQEAEYIKQAKDEWIEKYKQVLKEHSETRLVSELETTTIISGVEKKFNRVMQLLKDKYLSKVFTLQESVLLRSKKRGNLPKHATNILKTWLFQHFLVIILIFFINQQVT